MQCDVAFLAPHLPFTPLHTALSNTASSKSSSSCKPSRSRTVPNAVRIAEVNTHRDRWTPENLGFLHIATITAPHGVKGEVKVRAVGDFEKLRLASAIHTTDRFLLLPGRKYPRPCNLLAGRSASQPSTWILKLDGVTNREAVAKLRGARLFVKDSDTPRLARNEYMVGDLIGARISLLIHDHQQDSNIWQQFETAKGNLRAGYPAGLIERVITRDDLCHASGTGPSSAAVAADLLEVALFTIDNHPDKHHITVDDIPEKADRVLIPFVPDIVPVVDIARSIVVLDPPPGLLSIAVVNRKEKPRPPRGLLLPAKR